MKQRREDLDAVDRARTRSVEVGGAIHDVRTTRLDCPRSRGGEPFGVAIRILPRGFQLVSARHDEQDVRIQAHQLIPGDFDRALARLSSHVRASRDLDHLRDPMPRDEGGIQPLDPQQTRSRSAFNPFADAIQTPPQIAHEASRRLSSPGPVAHLLDRLENSLQRVRV